jgi:hypothetical protein
VLVEVGGREGNLRGLRSSRVEIVKFFVCATSSVPNIGNEVTLLMESQTTKSRILASMMVDSRVFQFEKSVLWSTEVTLKLRCLVSQSPSCIPLLRVLTFRAALS